MKICYVCDTLPFTHDVYSGAEITCEMVSQVAKELGHKVFYITSKTDFFDVDNTVYSLPKSHSKNFPVDLHIITLIRDILKYEKPDIIHLYTKQYLFPSIIASYLQRIKIIYSVVDYHMVCPNNILLDKNGRTCNSPLGFKCSNCYYGKYPFPINKILTIIQNNLLKWFYNHTDMFLTFTEESRWRLISFGIPQEKIDYVYQ